MFAWFSNIRCNLAAIPQQDPHASICMQAQDRFRVNLFKVFAPLQLFARSSLWPDDINFRLTAYIYPAFVLLLLLGPQERSTNFGLNLFWCYWWPLSFIIYPFLGRIWCSGELLIHTVTEHPWAGGHVQMLTTDFKQGCAWQPLPGSLGQLPGIGKATQAL